MEDFKHWFLFLSQKRAIDGASVLMQVYGWQEKIEKLIIQTSFGI